MPTLTLRSPREIALLRNAGLLVWEAHNIAKKLVRPGVTTAELDKAIDDFFESRGAIPLFKGVPGKVPYPAATCISVNEEVVHGIPGPRTLKEGDIVSIDTGCKLDGWCGDAAVTCPVGEVSDTNRKLLEVTQGCLLMAIELMAKCKMWSDIAKEMEAYVKAAGFSVVESFVGHGIGRKLHEDPQVPNFDSVAFRRKGDFKIEPGLVLAIEPMVNVGTKAVKAMPDHWTQSTTDGLPSAHFEHTVAMTADGPFVLTAGPNGELTM